MAPLPGGFPPPPGIYPPSRPPSPRRNGPIIAAALVAAVAVLSVAGLIAGLTLRDASATDPTAVGPATPSASSGPSYSSGPPSSTTTSQADQAAIRSSMQTFVDAFNSRDVERIKTAVCATIRPEVTSAPAAEGNLVLEDLTGVSVSGDFAESQVVTHLESGAQRSMSKSNDEKFVREDGKWYFCPGSRPDMGT